MPASSPLPSRPAAVQIALLLVYVILLYRLVLVGSMYQRIDVSAASPESFASATEVLRQSRIPGRLGNPLLFPVLIPGIIVVRRFMRHGHGWAVALYVGYLALRSASIVLRGPWNLQAGALFLLMVGCAALLLSPASREWLDACDASRRELRESIG